MNLKKIPESIRVFGNAEWRGDCQLESAEQVAFLSMLQRTFPELAKIAVHIRNEGKRTKRQGYLHKIEGMNTGASDIIIPVSPPIVLELKRRNHILSSISGKQISYLDAASKQGAFACVAIGAIGAMQAVEAWHTLHGEK